MDKKNIVLIVILVVIILFYFQIMEYLGLYNPAPTRQPVQDSTEVVQRDTQPTPPQPQATATPPPPIPVPADSTVDSLVVGETPDTSIAADTVAIVTKSYRILLSSRGGGPVSILLNDYTYRDGKPVQMLPDDKEATPDMRFAGGTYSIAQLNYESSLAPGVYDATSEPLSLEYTYRIASGGELIKKYTFYPDKYNYDLEFSVNNPGKFGFDRKYELVWNTPLGVTEPQPKTDYQAMEAVAMMGGSREKLDDFKDDKLKQSLSGNTEWAGVRSKYFASVMIPVNREGSGAVAYGYKDKIETADGELQRRFVKAGIEMEFASITSFTDSFKVFVGPLDYKIMASYDVGLEDILGIGTTPFVGWIMKPFAIAVMWLLPLMYDVIPNYGLVIIVFALLVKLVTMPLSMKSFKSMQAMKELQPKIEELKQKYKKNQTQMNAEMMKLYKKHGVKPMAGCLPIILQMPLFFAMFSVFRQTILLRNAPFVWFIKDLSQGATSFTDPLMALVLFMVAAQFISQKLTMPSNQQNKAMGYVVPLIMGWAFHTASSGLILYWTCFSILSLLDYFLFKRNKLREQQVQPA